MPIDYGCSFDRLNRLHRRLMNQMATVIDQDASAFEVSMLLLHSMTWYTSFMDGYIESAVRGVYKLPLGAKVLWLVQWPT